MFESISQVIMSLTGILRELEFGENLDGEEFENYLLKNKIYQIWKDNDPGIFAKMNKSKNDISLYIFFNILNEFLNTQTYTKEQAQIVNDKINIFFVKVFRFYIQKETEKKDYKELIKELEDLQIKGLMQKAIVQQIKDLINSKTFKELKQNKKMEVVKIETLKQFDYAIITALEEDEMEKVLPMIEKEGEFEESHNYIEYGHLKGNIQKKIVYASQHKTGMVDASILATEMIIRFNPKFLIMVGVLGGKPVDTNIGDVIIANKVFEIERGKLTDLGFKKEISSSNLNTKEIIKINRSKKIIENFINESDNTRKTNVQIHFGPIACVNQVIDVKNFFKDNISEVERKAIALEMESFAIVRACELVNNGNTKPIIIKSVMDNTQDKTDEGKTYASWTSSKCLEYILLNNLI